MPTRKIFISYAHKDEELVYPLAKQLADLGFHVWIDTQNLQGGNLWRQEIVDEITSCDAFLLCLSSHAIKSSDVRRELDLASDQQKLILPLLLESVKIPTAMQYQLAGIQWIQIRDNLDDAIKRILIALASSPKPASPQSDQNHRQNSESNSRFEGKNVSVKGNANGSIIITGDNNTIK